ncbi:MAG: hypothetical protein HY395_01400 [Candidatus Doudnabacteria bacterium]|nr:hypothetical protein [Candidatus Doudnabacteria bacterium]
MAKMLPIVAISIERKSQLRSILTKIITEIAVEIRRIERQMPTDPYWRERETVRLKGLRAYRGKLLRAHLEPGNLGYCKDCKVEFSFEVLKEFPLKARCQSCEIKRMEAAATKRRNKQRLAGRELELFPDG